MKKKTGLIIAFVLAVTLFGGSAVQNVQAAETPGYVTVAQPKTNIVGDISIIREVNSVAELTEVMKADRLPSTISVNIDSSANVVDKDGNKVMTVADFIAKLEYKVLPVFCVADKAAVDELTNVLAGLQFYDVCVMSKDASLVKHARTVMPAVRGAVDFTEAYSGEKKLSDAQLVTIRKTVVENKAYIAKLPAELCKKEAVQHLYEGRIPVWAELSEDASVKAEYSAVLSGAVGVISDNTEGLFEIACDSLEKDTVTRTSLNVGHKGIPSKALENTLAGGKAAVEAGAQALEIDMYMSRDGHVVIIHSNTTGATCDKNLMVSQATLEELKAINVVQNEDGTGKDLESQKIPTLREFFEEFKDSDVRFFLEFKGGGEAIVKAVSELVEEYNMYDRCTVIAFDTGVMSLVGNIMPAMPVSYLTFTNPIDEFNADASFVKAMAEIGKYNATFSPSISTQGSQKGTRAAGIRGVALNGWTYIKQSTYLVSYMNGAVSITGDDAAAMTGWPMGLVPKNLEDGMKVNKGEAIALDVTEVVYNGKNAVDTGLDCLVLEGDGVVVMNGNQLTFNKAGEITFVLEYQHEITSINIPTVYSEPITVTVLGSEDEAYEEDGKDDIKDDIKDDVEDDIKDDDKDEEKDNQEDDAKEDVKTGDLFGGKIAQFGMIALAAMIVIAFVVCKKKEA